MRSLELAGIRAMDLAHASPHLLDRFIFNDEDFYAAIAEFFPVAKGFLQAERLAIRRFERW